MAYTSAPYGEVLQVQRRLADHVRESDVPRAYLLLVEHNPVVTIGRNGKRANILVSDDALAKKGVELFHVERGGDVTFHGAGQLVGYPILRLSHFHVGVKAYVRKLEEALLWTLERLAIKGELRAREVGVWVEDRKIASLGIRIAQGVAYHGFALNVHTDLAMFGLINPCGVPGGQMTSISRECGIDYDLERVAGLVVSGFKRAFGLGGRLEDPILFRHWSSPSDALGAAGVMESVRGGVNGPLRTDGMELTSRDAPEQGPAERTTTTAARTDLLHGTDALVSKEPRFPRWLHVPLGGRGTGLALDRAFRKYRLGTVCRTARCPNIFDCWGRRRATFMILGDICTRACRYCAVGMKTDHVPGPLDETEPERIARAVEELDLDHVVVTSVTRDDLADGGAGQFASVVRAVRGIKGRKRSVEVLVPELAEAQIRAVLAENPDVFGHNIEVVERLFARVRQAADYSRSLEVLRAASRHASANQRVKSGLMVGLGETFDETIATFKDLREAGCHILTVGQYLRPSRHAVAVARFVSPDEFETLKEAAYKLGFEHVVAGPFVRSSYA